MDSGRGHRNSGTVSTVAGEGALTVDQQPHRASLNKYLWKKKGESEGKMLEEEIQMREWGEQQQQGQPRAQQGQPCSPQGQLQLYKPAAFQTSINRSSTGFYTITAAVPALNRDSPGRAGKGGF